ncbi:MAG TPA: dihydrodipicolinate synthase family protein [Clostridiales bacterium]|jgi:4-hydroxy-tetrahydrodipicolinate synthase|nr:dihydrodipicolinate synthase family protein [Clostridiales bacterium]
MSFTPEGIVIPVVTPIDKNERFDEIAYRKLVEYFVENGVHGIFPFGTTGEFYAFDDGFYRHMLEVTKDAVKGRMAIYAGANHITTRRAVEIAKLVEDVGDIEALSVLTPMFISQTRQEVYEYYREIAEATCLPIVVYNNRPKTNVMVDPATVVQLAEIPNIVAVKDSTGDMNNTAEYLRLTQGMDFHVMMGRDTLIYAGLCYGASGAIASCANVAPGIAVDIYEKHKQGDHKGALEAQFKLTALRNATSMGSFPVTIKEALKLIGYDCGDCIKPIQPLNEEQRTKLRSVLQDMGIL